jgi:hypothetical protein
VGIIPGVPPLHTRGNTPRNVGRQTVALLAALDLYIYDYLDAPKAAVLEIASVVEVTANLGMHISEEFGAIKIPKRLECLTY